MAQHRVAGGRPHRRGSQRSRPTTAHSSDASHDVQPRAPPRSIRLDLRVRHAGGAGHGTSGMRPAPSRVRSDLGSERQQMAESSSLVVPAITDPLGHDAMVADGARLAISGGCSRCERSGASVRQPVASPARRPRSSVAVARTASGAGQGDAGMRACARTASTRGRRRIIGARCASTTSPGPREPFRLDELWPFTERLERFGIAGFGLGRRVGAPTAALCRHRDVRAFRDDPAARRGRRRARRPRRSSTSGGPRSSRPSSSPTPSRSTTRPAGSRSATTATSARSATWRDALPGAGPDPRPRRHRGRGALAGGRLGRRPDAGAAPPRAPRDVRRPGEPRRAQPPTATPSTTPATPRTRSSRSASGGSGSPRPAIYSLDRSLFQLRRAGRDRAAPGPRRRTPSTLDRNGSADLTDVVSDSRSGVG